MNDELSKELLSIVKGAKEVGIKATDVLQEQAPILCEEIIKYNIILGFIVIVFFSITSLIGIKTFMHGLNNTHMTGYKDDQNEEITQEGVGICMASGILLVFSLLVIIIGLPDFIKAIFAPKLFLLEYVKDLI
tara:strand:- start:1428 stop:1826 length:399 start_codon:yes stop_codon:yes gene_type:complete